VGWYKYGAAPGSKGGSTVIVGHRDGTDPEPGAFYYLNKLNSKNSIVVEYLNYTAIYAVKSVNIISKKNFYKISKDIFSLKGKPRITLISCIGPYDKNKGGYQKNIIVTAEPLTGYPWILYNRDLDG
jgi:LPXTG-site transpeptidase (sortase) family protein